MLHFLPTTTKCSIRWRKQILTPKSLREESLCNKCTPRTNLSAFVNNSASCLMWLEINQSTSPSLWEGGNKTWNNALPRLKPNHVILTKNGLILFKLKCFLSAREITIFTKRKIKIICKENLVHKLLYRLCKKCLKLFLF